MASRYTIDEALEAILDDDFGLSDGDSSDEEGEDIYCYVGEPVLRRADVDILGGSIADGLLVDREDDSEVSEENGRTISSDPPATEHEHSGDNQSSADESASHDFHDNGVASDSDTSSVGSVPVEEVVPVEGVIPEVGVVPVVGVVPMVGDVLLVQVEVQAVVLLVDTQIV